MSTNTKKLSEEMAEIKVSLNFMSEEISTVVKQQKTLMGLMEEIHELKIINKQRDQRIEFLEQRVDDLEQYSRADDLIITGLETKHQCYARVANPAADQQGEDAPAEELHTLEKQVVQFLSSKNIHLESHQISACHTLPRKDSKTNPTIVVKFVNRKHKVEVLKQAKKLKGTGVYVNEHLTKKNAEIARNGRILRKQSKIQATWTRNGKVYIRLNGPPEQAKVVVVRNLRDLEQYK